MTMALLHWIIEENHIPDDVHFMSDSGWECDPTEMDGVFYNKQMNTIVFTQGDIADRNYEYSDEWEILYAPGLIKAGGLEIYPVDETVSYRVTEEFKKELKSAGEFESYYGFRESDEAYLEIDLRRPMFYSIMRNGSFIGYIGFRGDDDTLETEIYIFKQYRNKGYGSSVLRKLIDIAFTDGLIKKRREKNKEGRLPLYVTKSETIYPSKLVATVRVENNISQKMMKTCGFIENTYPVAIFLAFADHDITDDAQVDDAVQVREYVLSRENYIKGSTNLALSGGSDDGGRDSHRGDLGENSGGKEGNHEM